MAKHFAAQCTLFRKVVRNSALGGGTGKVQWSGNLNGLEKWSGIFFSFGNGLEIILARYEPFYIINGLG